MTFRFSTLLLSLLAVISLAASAGFAAATEQAWTFKRNNGLGPETIYATNAAVLITYPGVGLNILCKSPTWEIVWFNTRNHLWYHQTVGRYRAGKGMPPVESQLPQKGRIATNYAGHDAIEFDIAATNPEDFMLLQSGFGKIRGRAVATQYYFSKPLSLSKESMMFLNSYFGVPASGGIPLGAHLLYSDKTVQRLWTTTSFSKTAIEPKLFQQPAGYKLAANADKVGSAAAYTTQIQDLMDGMEVGKPFGH